MFRLHYNKWLSIGFTSSQVIDFISKLSISVCKNAVAVVVVIAKVDTKVFISLCLHGDVNSRQVTFEIWITFCWIVNLLFLVWYLVNFLLAACVFNSSSSSWVVSVFTRIIIWCRCLPRSSQTSYKINCTSFFNNIFTFTTSDRNQWTCSVSSNDNGCVV